MALVLVDDHRHHKAAWPGTLGAMTRAFSNVEFADYQPVGS